MTDTDAPQPDPSFEESFAAAVIRDDSPGSDHEKARAYEVMLIGERTKRRREAGFLLNRAGGDAY